MCTTCRWHFPMSFQEVLVAWDTLQDCSGNHFCHWKTQLVPQMVENNLGFSMVFIFFPWRSLRFSTWTTLKNVKTWHIYTYLSSSIRKHLKSAMKTPLPTATNGQPGGCPGDAPGPQRQWGPLARMLSDGRVGPWCPVMPPMFHRDGSAATICGSKNGKMGDGDI